MKNEGNLKTGGSAIIGTIEFFAAAKTFLSTSSSC
jgi:hypothetical protein